MKYNELEIDRHKQADRKGRGIAAGQGKTAGRGTKGQKSRTGSKKKPGFEGGSNPLMQRLPKLHGFKSHKVKPEHIYTGQLETLGKAKVDNQILTEAGLTSSAHVVVKLLFKGDLTKKVTVQIQSSSKTASEAVKKAGGTFERVPQVKRVKVQVAEKPKVKSKE